MAKMLREYGTIDSRHNRIGTLSYFSLPVFSLFFFSIETAMTAFAKARIMFLQGVLVVCCALPVAGDDRTVMLLMAPKGPVFAEMNITVDDAPYRLWVTRFLMDKVDMNRDGELSIDELRLIPDRLRQQAKAGSPKRILRKASGSKEAESVKAEVFNNWFGKQLDRGFNVVAGAVQASEAVRLASHIDADSNGKVSRSEVEGASYALRFRDLDDDETFTASELMPYRDPRNQQAAVVPDAADLPFVQLTDTQTIKRAAAKIVARYGMADGLKCETLRMPETAPKPFDKDGDGLMTVSEVEAMLIQCPVHLVMNIRLSDRENASDLEIVVEGFANDFCIVESGRRGRSKLTVDEMPISIRARGGTKATRGMMVNFVLQRTSIYDEDKNGYLSEDEFPQMQQQLAMVQVTGSFQDVDLNGDEMVNRREIQAYIEKDTIATQSRIEVSVKQDGKTLFKLLDENADRRLSLRELNEGFDRLIEYDISDDGQLTEDELGTAYALQIGLGIAESMRIGSDRTMNGMMQGNSTDAILPGMAGLEGPEWFKRMDRNQDRDVSRREFLGPQNIFQQLDENSDGLLSATEAARIE